jgi:hypothetical protein
MIEGLYAIAKALDRIADNMEPKDQGENAKPVREVVSGRARFGTEEWIVLCCFCKEWHQLKVGENGPNFRICSGCSKEVVSISQTSNEEQQLTNPSGKSD